MIPPDVLTFSFWPSAPTIFGILGPWISMSQMPTWCPFRAKLTARFVVTVLLPTPPLLLITNTYTRSAPSAARRANDYALPCPSGRSRSRRKWRRPTDRCRHPRFRNPDAGSHSVAPAFLLLVKRG